MFDASALPGEAVDFKQLFVDVGPDHMTTDEGRDGLRAVVKATKKQ
jgi:hypothetical protein